MDDGSPVLGFPGRQAAWQKTADTASVLMNL